jgi:hypothetical protein
VHYFAVLNEIDGNVSVCEVSADNCGMESRLCYFKRHISGATWPHGACHWVHNERMFISVVPALTYARALLKERIDTLSLSLAHVCHNLEGPPPTPPPEPVTPKVSVWDHLRNLDL